MDKKPSICHPDKPLYALGLCRGCYERQLRERNPEYAERQRANSRVWHRKHTAYLRDQNRERQRQWSHEQKRNAHLRKNFGITLEQYNELLADQGGVCAICGKPPNGHALHVDHDHDTGAIRGLLCFRCNYGMTWFEENADRLARASSYLRQEHHKFHGKPGRISDHGKVEWGKKGRHGKGTV